MRVGELLAVGRTADVHAFGPDEVVKIPHPDTPQHWAEIEAELATTVHDHGLPSPSVRDLTVIDGRACIVFERVHGPPMWELMLDDPSQVPRLTSQLVEVQRMIHTAGIPASVPDLTARLHSKVSVCSAIEEPERAEAGRIVAALPRGAALLHGDLHPGNVLLGSNGPVVIDWFDAAIGHPIADVVRSSLLLRLGFEGGDRRSLSSSTRSLLRRSHGAYVDAWQASLPLESSVVRQWEPVLALARISEGAQGETAPLLQLWDERPVDGGGFSPR